MTRQVGRLSSDIRRNQVAIYGNAGIAGAVMAYDSQSVEADADGNYIIIVHSNWSGTVTPAKTGYTFTPASNSYTNITASDGGEDYTAEVTTYTISGNAQEEGVTLTYIDGIEKTVQSVAGGDYSLDVTYNWSGTVTPTLGGYEFTPASRTYTNVLADVSGEDYTAEAANAILYATVGDGETVTLRRITPTGGNVVVDWGDGGDTSTVLANNTGTTTHVYTSAGTYTITLSDPELITYLDLGDAKLTVNSADIAPCKNVTTFNLSNIKSVAFNSSDLAQWNPDVFTIQSTNASFSGDFNFAHLSWHPTRLIFVALPDSFIITLNSADIGDWQPSRFEVAIVRATGLFDTADISSWGTSISYFRMYLLGITSVFNTADLAEWNPGTFQYYAINLNGRITVAENSFVNWTNTTAFSLSSASLPTSIVDALLGELWNAFPFRVATGGTIDLQWQSPPSGTYQAADPPTTGKEFAFELLNDSENINPTKKWATISVAGGLP